MCNFKTCQITDIVEHIHGQDKLIREPQTGREVLIDRQMDRPLITEVVTGFCSLTTSQEVEVVDQPGIGEFMSKR